MKKFARGFLAFWAMLLWAFPAFALDVPQVPEKGYVLDLTKSLSGEQVQKLNQKIDAHFKKSSNQIFVLMVNSLQGETIEGYSIKVAEKWKPGMKKKDNGVLVVVSKSDRKTRIEVGFGLEGRLTDLISGRIISQEMAPKFKEGKFYEGLDACVGKIEQTVSGEYKAEPEKKTDNSRAIITLVIIVVVVFFGSLSSFLGGIAGAIGGFFVASLYGLIWWPWILLCIIVGIIVGVILPKIFGDGGLESLSEFLSSGSGDSGSTGGGGGGFGGGGASGDW